MVCTQESNFLFTQTNTKLNKSTPYTPQTPFLTPLHHVTNQPTNQTSISFHASNLCFKFLTPKISKARRGKDSVISMMALNSSNPNFGGLERERSGLALMQNCDLPPPVKVFAGPDKVVLSTMTRVYNAVVEGSENDGLGCGENEKLELLKALRLSQTRAREAEKKAADLTKERDCLRRVLLEDSSWLYGYQQLVKLLELQLSREQGQGQFYSGCRRSKEDEDGKHVAGMTWFVAWTLCLGIAGVGFAIGCRYIF